ncbi:hypothetical protein ZIOFF_061288 [Zingiber officinale]|uniref:ORM1-like protein 3 n=1 Tax=Zingiber officinale TaxID=94328 RepID=A0A8J5F1L4_ZINOF|nr:hypothetical protein ZIOFF_061288 [Zingiber officinale]
MICSRYQRWPKFSAGPFRLLGRLLFLTSFSFEPCGRGFASFPQSLSLVNPKPDCCRREIGGEVLLGRMTKLYVEAVQPADLNKNTEWFMYPGVWTTYILILFFSWLLVLSLFGCAPGMAWTFVNLAHFAIDKKIYILICFFFQITYHFFHWKKGTPFSDDQGIYNSLTWWEQMDNGKQLTRNRKFLAVVPVVLYLIASHTTDYRHPMLFLNTVAVTVLVVAKLPNMHKVRIFGINAGH